MTRTVDNNGLGALYATFNIDKTGAYYDLDSEDIGDAVALSNQYEVDHGSNGSQVLGRLEHVDNGLATVQIAGVARFDIDTGKTAPVQRNAVVLNGSGKVYQAPVLTGYDPAGGNVARGIVLSVDSTNHTCDVLLG